jgi:glucose-6-phosphatase
MFKKSCIFRLFHGHRPYWWVNIYAKDVTLYQTPITCETGPGNPSGHVMLNLVLGLALVNLVKKLLKFDNDEWSQNDNPTKLVITRLLWNAFYVWTASVIVSRIYIAAHFPHQCLYAVGFGYFAFEIGFHQKIVKWTAWSFTKHIYLAGFFLGSALLVYTNVEKYLGFDINWSITLANKFCQKVFFFIYFTVQYFIGLVLKLKF